MRRIVILTLLYICVSSCCAQIYRYPVFDRTDEPRFHIDSVELTKDSTFLYCSYEAAGSSWACISDSMFLEDTATGLRYQIMDVKGIPFNPNRRRFDVPSTINVVLLFPSAEFSKFNLIEDEYGGAFNIYGINICHSYTRTYTSEDIQFYFNTSHKKQEDGDWRAAIKYTLRQLESTNYVEGTQSFASACSMYNLTLIYFGMRDYDKVIEWGKKTIDILRVLPQDSLILDVLARAYGNVASAFHMMSQHDRGRQYEELSLTTRRISEGIGSVSYEEYLAHLARSYYYEGNQPKALLYGREAADIYRAKCEDNSRFYGCSYVNSLANLCEYCLRMDETEDAFVYGNKARDLIEKGICIDSITALRLKMSIYCNLAGALAMKNEVDGAVNYLNIVLDERNTSLPDYYRVEINARMLLADIFLEARQDSLSAIKEYGLLNNMLSGDNTIQKDYFPEYSSILEKMYRYYKWRDPSLSIHYLKELIQTMKGWLGEESVGYADACLEYVSNPFILTAMSKDRLLQDSLLYYLKKSSDIIKRHISLSVYNMSRKKRMSYWERYDYLYTWLIPTICSLLNESDEAKSLAYDASLFYKGMLLSSEKDFKEIVQESQDESLKSLYRAYVSNCSLLESHLSNPMIEIDSLKEEILNQEYLLAQKATRFNRQYKGTNISWKEIQAKLNNDDIAIEFVSYDNANYSKIFYDAYIIDNKSRTPLIVPLFDDSQLNEIVSEGKVDMESLSNLIWGNPHIVKAIQGKKNVFFSAAGILNTIGIEYLPIEKGNYVCEKYNIYRLSSTRELCYSHIHHKPEKVCLFGGLDYESTTNGLFAGNSQEFLFARAALDTIANRGGFDPLFGSKQEIQEVAQELSQRQIHFKVFSNTEGTECAFKKLSGSDFDIIHLSTHGMYVSNDTPPNSTRGFSFIISNETPAIDKEIATLSQSVLVMSGGNMLLKKDSIANGEEDGLLTALEISHLDFKNLDLVVLSACETALGVIDTEGVYGLQRGFKKAGAKTILMSLDKVDDEATRILMVEFYKNLLGGKSKHDSLRDAQKYLRQVENGKYDDPKYWASFILLDGLN